MLEISRFISDFELFAIDLIYSVYQAKYTISYTFSNRVSRTLETMFQAPVSAPDQTLFFRHSYQCFHDRFFRFEKNFFDGRMDFFASDISDGIRRFILRVDKVLIRHYLYVR